MKIDVTSEDLALINQYTRRQLTAEDVFVFSVVLCDNDVDKDFERFTVKSLYELEKLYIGKTGFLKHNLTARLFDCEVEHIKRKKTRAKDDYYRLIGKAYIVKTDSNLDVIKDIESGNLKEVSIGCAVKNNLCSICGNDIYSYLCTHTKGKKYKRQLCCCELVDVIDAYEFAVVTDIIERKEDNNAT